MTHSMRVDSLAAGSPARVEACEVAADAMDEYVRDHTADATLIIAGINDDAWELIEAPEIVAGRKREFVRVAGMPLLTLEYVRDGETES